MEQFCFLGGKLLVDITAGKRSVAYEYVSRRTRTSNRGSRRGTFLEICFVKKFTDNGRAREGRRTVLRAI